MKPSSEIRVQNLDHLGLVAGIIDEMGLVEQINQQVGQHDCERVSPGHVVKAMILDGLGFVSAPLYLFSRFFEGKATEHLIGEGVLPEHLNDDKLGRVLDKLYLTGLSQLFTVVALAAAKKFGVSTKSAHLDSTSFHVHGQYKNTLPLVSFVTGGIKPDDPKGEALEETEVDSAIHITYGYSRDHRPDLKQFILDLISSGDGDVPLFLRVADGNEADKAVFAKVLCDFRQQLSLDTLVIADSALSSADNVTLLKDIKWLCRVPLTVAEAKKLVSQLTKEDFVKSELSGYWIAAHTSNYGGVAQRWLVVESETRKKADLRQLEQRLSKSEKEASKKLQRLCAQKFACPQDAIDAAKSWSQQLKYHCLTDIQAVELLPDQSKQASVKASQTLNISYRIQAPLVRKQNVIETETRHAGRFVLATNVIDVAELSKDEMLSEYKAQQSARSRRAEYSVRRTRALSGGLAFLKTPCFLPTVFSSNHQKE